MSWSAIGNHIGYPAIHAIQVRTIFIAKKEDFLVEVYWSFFSMQILDGPITEMQ